MIKERLIGSEPFASEPLYESIPERVTIICSVRNSTKEYREKIEKYVKKLEEHEIKVFLPFRDNDQNDTGINICENMKEAINWCDRVDIFYSGSEGTLFDMGVTFMCNYGIGKPIKIIENLPFDNFKKSFPKMLKEWEDRQDVIWGI